jgi:hypothetical protein
LRSCYVLINTGLEARVNRLFGVEDITFSQRHLANAHQLLHS